jgi:alpha-D-ribose 1-methylphosphonate 5-triphosphate synthase subunit PhnH
MNGAPATLGERARAIRLDAYSAQRGFGLLLDSLARPGTLVRLEVAAGTPPALLPAVTLADVEVALGVVGDEEWAAAAHAVTGAPRADIAEADLVVALRPLAPDELLRLRRGSALAPEKGARLVLAVDQLDADTGALRLTLTGPGVPDEQAVGVTGLSHDVVTALQHANSEFPAGLDVHLVARDGVLASIPRSATVRVVEPQEHTRTTTSERKVS